MVWLQLAGSIAVDPFYKLQTQSSIDLEDKRLKKKKSQKAELQVY